MSRREVILEEMGLAPLWRLRTPAARPDREPRESGVAEGESSSGRSQRAEVDAAPTALAQPAASPVQTRSAAADGESLPEYATAASTSSPQAKAASVRKAPAIPLSAHAEDEAHGRR